jgi:hypothetical protein
MNEYDFGFIEKPINGRGFKVTLNKFREVWYIHIREYIEDGDTQKWYPTKKGIAIRGEYADLLSFIFNDIGDLLTKIYHKDIKEIIEVSQLDFFKELE